MFCYIQFLFWGFNTHERLHHQIFLESMRVHSRQRIYQWCQSLLPRMSRAMGSRAWKSAIHIVYICIMFYDILNITYYIVYFCIMMYYVYIYMCVCVMCIYICMYIQDVYIYIYILYIKYIVYSVYIYIYMSIPHKP
jgi:hypothetical protein